MALTTMDVVKFRIEKGPGRTQRQLSEAIFGGSGYQQRVNVECDMLTRNRQVVRYGGGGRADPYTYYPADPRPRDTFLDSLKAERSRLQAEADARGLGPDAPERAKIGELGARIRAHEEMMRS